MRIEFVYWNDPDNTVYSAIRCRELIGKMSDISEAEKEQMLNIIDDTKMCPDIETIEIGYRRDDAFVMEILVN